MILKVIKSWLLWLLKTNFVFCPSKHILNHCFFKKNVLQKVLLWKDFKAKKKLSQTPPNLKLKMFFSSVKLKSTSQHQSLWTWNRFSKIMKLRWWNWCYTSKIEDIFDKYNTNYMNLNSFLKSLSIQWSHLLEELHLKI